MKKHTIALLFLGFALISFIATASAAELLIGTSHTNITPDRPVSLSGQHRTRIARKVDNPCTATAVALESRQGDKVLDQAVMVSCDLISIRGGIRPMFLKKMASRLPDLDLKKVFFNGTHTHTAPTMLQGAYPLPKDAMQPVEFVDFVTDRLCDLVVEAWKSRKPGGVSWGLGHAVVALNRRLVYADGSVRMYGPTHVKNFRRVEGPEDHGVEVLFFWDGNNKLSAVAVNVACPSQEVEHLKNINADFWHDVRVQLRKRHGEDLCVLAWPGAGGDQSPHLQWREKAEERMRKGRGLSRTAEIARRIVRAVDEAHEVARSDIRRDAPLVHVVDRIELPVRMVTDKEYAQRKAVYDKLAKKKSPTENERRLMRSAKGIINRYNSQKDNPFCEMELHVLRLGDVAIATNRFELYTDYGVQIKARSKAMQTFVIQLSGAGKYLPTARAIEGGGYSTEVQSVLVGPQGGQVLVDRTVEEINKLWGGKGD